jgi:hypothetical protein
MSSSVLAGFKSNTVEDVRKLFLGIAKARRTGYHTTFDEILEFLGRYDGLNQKQKNQLKKDILSRNISKYGLERGKEYEIYIEDNPNKKKQHLANIYKFSDRGFKIFCMCIKSPKLKLIIEYYVNLEFDYIKRLSAEKEENKSISDDLEVYAEKIKELTKQAEEYEKKTKNYIIWTGEEENVCEKAEKQLESESNLNNKINTISIDVLPDTSPDISFNDYYYSTIIKKTYMKSIYMIVMDPKTLERVAIRKKKDMNKSKNTIIQMELDAENSDLGDITDTEDPIDDIDLGYDITQKPEKQDVAYYSIMMKEPADKSRLCAVLYIEKKDGFTNLKEYLNKPENKLITVKDNVWQTSISAIEEYLKNGFIDKYRSF